MKQVFFSMLAVSLFLSSCNNKGCDTVSCDGIFPDITFKIVNSSGQNLTCGPNKIYTSDKFQVKTFFGGNYFDQPKTFNGDSTQAATPIVFSASGLSSQYFLFINNIKTDSFQVTYDAFPGRSDCCPSFNKITQIKLNTVTATMPFNVVK